MRGCQKRTLFGYEVAQPPYERRPTTKTSLRPPGRKSTSSRRADTFPVGTRDTLAIRHGRLADMFPSRYGSRIVMNDRDMTETSVNGYPNGKPERDIVPTDGMKITVGDRTVTIYLTPGHFQVHDHGKPPTVVYSGGTEFNFPNHVPHFDPRV